MSERVIHSLASDWEQVCEAAGLDTDATANEVIEAFQIDRDRLSEVLFEIYDHGSAPNAHREAGEVIKRLEGLR